MINDLLFILADVEIFGSDFFDKKVNLINSKTNIFTKSLAERKEIMIKKSDFFIALPGGFGTLDEVFELIALNQLAIINKKIIIFFTKHVN